MNYLEKRLSELNEQVNFDLEILDYFQDDQTADELIEAIEDGIRQEEVIYYHVAIDYLKEHDSSLNTSLSLAADLGTEPQNLNSEILATLLYQQELSEQLRDIEDDIKEIFEETEELEE